MPKMPRWAVVIQSTQRWLARWSSSCVCLPIPQTTSTSSCRWTFDVSYLHRSSLQVFLFFFPSGCAQAASATARLDILESSQHRGEQPALRGSMHTNTVAPVFLFTLLICCSLIRVPCKVAQSSCASTFLFALLVFLFSCGIEDDASFLSLPFAFLENIFSATSGLFLCFVHCEK